jgi:hypothetical protein
MTLPTSRQTAYIDIRVERDNVRLTVGLDSAPALLYLRRRFPLLGQTHQESKIFFMNRLRRIFVISPPFPHCFDSQSLESLFTCLPPSIRRTPTPTCRSVEETKPEAGQRDTQQTSRQDGNGDGKAMSTDKLTASTSLVSP